MLDKLDLSIKMEKAEYKAVIEKLYADMGDLQRKARESGIPVVIVFEGWGAAGKGTQINNLMLALDPRGFKVNLTKAPTEEEYLRPFLWRFWAKLPAKGRIAIFDRSWYRRVLVDRIDKTIPRAEWERAYDEINSFERQLTDDNCVIVKFMLHIGKKEQKARFDALLANPSTAWKVTKNDWKQQKQYSEYVTVFDDMISKTSPKNAAWTIVEAQDHRFASVKIAQAINNALTLALAKKDKKVPVKSSLPIKKIPALLDKADLTLALPRDVYAKDLKAHQARLREIEHEIYTRRIPVLIVYEGWDAAGKGGNIRRLVTALDPRGYEVVPFAAPNDIERAHHYLWRFWQNIPKGGHIHIFDRSWYGRVMVERIEKFCTEAEWKRAFDEINEFEKQCTDFGVVMIKFWLQIDKDEQLKRFKMRQDTPDKLWKITDEDWRNRDKWERYHTAVDEMIFRTSTKNAPWTIVEANDKLYARIKAMNTVISAVEKKLQK